MTVYAPLRLHAPSRRDAVVVELPVVLAPMAGVTNAAYRQLCREQGAGLYVCEMITSRGLVVGDHKTKDMLAFDPGETTRSVQLYGVDADVMADAARILARDYAVDHIDLNFGCPVPKVTRKGGGGVLPYKRDRLRAIVRETVRAADEFGVPVTIKTRIGIDGEHETFLDAGRIAEEEGAAAIALHGRTVQQAYSGEADWERIAELADAVDIPVLGNGDIWEAEDALRMMAATGCDGVVIGRGCLGRPGCSATWPPPSAARSCGCAPALARWGGCCCGTRSSSPASRASATASPTCASTWRGTSRDTPSASCAVGSRWCRPSPSWRTWSANWTQTPSSPSRSWAPPVDARDPPAARSSSRTAGTTTRPAASWT